VQAEILNIHEVTRMTGYKCRASIYNLVKSAGFPAPIRIGTRTVRWMRADVMAWMDQQAQRRTGEA